MALVFSVYQYYTNLHQVSKKGRKRVALLVIITHFVAEYLAKPPPSHLQTHMAKRVFLHWEFQQHPLL